MKKIMVVLAFIAIYSGVKAQEKKIAPKEEKQFYVLYTDGFLKALNAKSDSIISVVMTSRMEARDAKRILDYVASIRSLFISYRAAELAADTAKKKGNK